MNNCSAWIWQLSKDYPGAEGDDSRLPLAEVLFKSHEGSGWMHKDHDLACVSQAALMELKRIYEEQNIKFIPWCVPRGGDVLEEAAIARKVLDITNTLVFDVEPGAPFFEGDRRWVEEYLEAIRESHPHAHLGLCYDPRSGDGVEDKLARIFFTAWVPEMQSLWPQCYFDTFAGQGRWGSPTGCVWGAWDRVRQETAPGTVVHYVLPGRAPMWDLMGSIFTAWTLGGTFSLWRRGIVTMENWAMLTSINPPRPQVDVEKLKGIIASAKRGVDEVDTMLRDGAETTAAVLKVLGGEAGA